ITALVNAASEYSTSSEWRDFVEQVWKPLQAQDRPTDLPVEQSNSLSTSLYPYLQAPIQEVQITNPPKKPVRRASNGRQKAAGMRGDAEHLAASPYFHDGSTSHQKNRIPEEFPRSAHNHVKNARAAIQVIIDLFQPEKDIYRDQ